LVARYGDLSATMADIVVGRIAAPLLRQASPAGESTLGALIADAFLTGASAPQGGHPGAQIALVGPGGIRGDLSSSLSVTFGQLFSVIPFANNLISMDLTGAQIVRVLEQQWEGKTGNGQIMAVSEGFSYTWDASAPSGAAPGQGRRVVPGSLMLDGKPMSMDATYRVVVDTFIAGGGDRFTVFKQGKNRVTGELDSAVLKLYFRMKPVVHVPTLGRVLRIN
jgi:5'-nucleotidase